MPQSQPGKTLVTAPLIARTSGYMPPEIQGAKFSPKSDMYSYGIVALEVYTALKAYDPQRVDAALYEHCEESIQQLEKFQTIQDPAIVRLKDMKLLKMFHSVILACLKRHSIRATSATVMQYWTEYDT